MESGSLKLFNSQIEDDFRGGIVRVGFVVPGTKTSSNPLKAFVQGLEGEPYDRIHDLSEVTSIRCKNCGFLEFYAAPPGN
jgi:hypothetical protein